MGSLAGMSWIHQQRATFLSLIPGLYPNLNFTAAYLRLLGINDLLELRCRTLEALEKTDQVDKLTNEQRRWLIFWMSMPPDSKYLFMTITRTF